MISNKQKIDFGSVKEGTIVKDTFTITNDSGSNINIVSINASCGCTVPNIERGILANNASRSVTVSFNTKGRKGSNFKNINIHYVENSEQKTFSVQLICNVI